jgi:hypothetical protein
MDWFFDQYVYGTGIPRYALKYTLENTFDGKRDHHAQRGSGFMEGRFGSIRALRRQFREARNSWGNPSRAEY